MADSESNHDLSTESLRWYVRLSDKDPKKLGVIGLASVTAGVAGVTLGGQLILGILGVLMVLGATAEYWMGTSFSVGPHGACRRVGVSLTSIPWSDVKRVIVSDEDIKLSPLTSESRLEPFRGVILRTTPQNRDRVLGLIRHFVDHDV